MLRFLTVMTICGTICFAQKADWVIVNARIYTVDPQRPEAHEIAIRGNRILAVGDKLDNLIAPETRQIDAHGRAIIPGFIDSHGHMAALGASLDQLDLRGVLSEAQIREKVAAAVKGKRAGEWIVGDGWDQNLWHNKEFPTKESLDAAAPDNPVALNRVDGHALWANSRALEIAGVTGTTPDPPGGRIERNANGPTGVLVDRARGLVDRRIPKPTAAQLEENLARAAVKCARVGLTTVHDAGIDRATWDAYHRLVAQERLPIRVYAMIALPDGRALWNERKAKGPEIGERLTVRSIKMWADGALGSRGAALTEPYSDDPRNRGLLILDRAFIEKTTREAAAAGFQVNTHAIGDLANRTVLDAYAAVLGGHNDRRFRIEHAQIVAPDDFARFHDFDVLASMQPTHATSDRDWAEARVGPKRILGAYAWRTFLKLGVHLPFGSDFPVEDPNPMRGFYAAITREGWHPEQCLTRAEALRSWTLEGAYAAFEEKDKGSLTPGKFADLIVLSDNIMEAPLDTVRAARVVMTMIDGKIVWQEE